MKKYYIPISSLYLDIILRSECIFPITICQQQKIDFEQIEELKCFQQIVLFGFPVHFALKDPDRINYPVLLEIEENDQISDLQKQHSFVEIDKGVYLCDRPLSFSPYGCKVYFYDEIPLKMISINLKDDTSVKYYKDYVITVFNKKQLKSIPPLNEYTHTNSRTVIDVSCLDRFKGILYAYMWGLSLSRSPELAHQARLTQDIYDNLTSLSLIIDKTKIPEPMITRLTSLLDEYKQIDPVYKKEKQYVLDASKKVWKSEGLEDDSLWEDCRFQSYLKKSGAWKGMCQQNRIEPLDLPSEPNKEDYLALRKITEEHTITALKTYRDATVHFSLDDISIDSMYKVVIKDKPIISTVVDLIIKNGIGVTDLSAKRVDICEEIGKTFKQLNGEPWKNSEERNYISQLFFFITHKRIDFNVKSCSNLEWQAIAAFLMKGDDLREYLNYLKKYEWTDYTNPMLLWGAMTGYTDMNRDYLRNTLTKENFNLVLNKMDTIYKAIYEHDNRGVPDGTGNQDLWPILESWMATNPNNEKYKSTFEKVLKRSGNNWNQFRKELKNEKGWKTKGSNSWKSLEKHFSERNGQLTLYAEQ